MKKLTILLLLILLTSLFLNLTPSTGAQASPATITIKTLDDEPLKGAVVEIKNATTSALIFRGTTDEDGEITPTIIHNKTYALTVFLPPGNEIYSTNTFNYSKTQTITVDAISKWTIRLYDNEGRDPVEDANVTITYSANSSVQYSKVTGSSGKVEFGPLPAGQYKVKVKFRGRTYDEGSHVVGVGSQETTFNLPLYRVLVRVKDVKGSPVESVIVSLREELDEDAIASATSNEDGEALIKLVPKGSYYLQASFMEYVVYETEGKDVGVYKDVEMDIEINAIKLNVTVYDADGKDIISGAEFRLRGELKSDGTLVAESETIDGVLRFGHVPLESFTLKIMLGDLIVYSGVYEISEETGEGGVNADFYDVTLKANTTGLANQTIAGSLNGVLKRGELEIRFRMSGGVGELKNVPAADDYVVELYFDDVKVAEIEDVEIEQEGQQITLPLTGYRLSVLVTNLKGEPVSADVVITLLNGTQVISFKTGDDGKGISPPLLPMSYNVLAYMAGVETGKKTVNLSSDMNITLQASVLDILLRVYDSDQEEVLKNVNIQLEHDGFKKSAMSAENGEVLFKNLPTTSYRVKVWYYGFKVLETEVKVSSGTSEIDLKAPGVLDVRLKFTDAMKRPLDSGLAVLSIGDKDVEVEAGEDGEARVRNLPNSTIYVKFFYKGVEVDIKPEEFDLKIDEAVVSFVTNVYEMTVNVVRADGEPLRDGVASVYVDGELVSSHNLMEENVFAERLPEGEVTVKVSFKGREVAEKTIYLEEALKEVTVKAKVHIFGITLYYSSGEPVVGAVVEAVDDGGKIGEAVSDESGYAAMLLPEGDYTFRINVGNETLEYGLELKGNVFENILYPVESGSAPVLAAGLAAVNVGVSALVFVKGIKGKVRPQRRRRPRRRVPRI